MSAIILFCLVAISNSIAAEMSCYKDVQIECAPSSSGLSLLGCNAKYGALNGNIHTVEEMQAYANLYLKRSYEYLLTASFFNNYKMNRAGFSKLFKKLSDDAWGKTIDLIKHITIRGGEMDFAQISNKHEGQLRSRGYLAELQELESLAKALDTQRELAEQAFHIHHEATRNSNNWHDPEIAQYIVEEFMEDQAKVIRQLAGHTNDLKKLISGNDKDLPLSLYLFDEYLQKTL